MNQERISKRVYLAICELRGVEPDTSEAGYRGSNQIKDTKLYNVAKKYNVKTSFLRTVGSFKIIKKI